MKEKLLTIAGVIRTLVRGKKLSPKLRIESLTLVKVELHINVNYKNKK